MDKEPYVKTTLTQVFEMVKQLESSVTSLEYEVRQQNHVKEDIEKLTEVCKGLSEKIQEHDTYIYTQMGSKKGRESVLSAIREWAPIIMAIVGLLIGRAIL